ncbi:hypothetical protein ACP6PL_09115, partial [Dapis sp. BLCC M126]|uniref:hypothetical protein n=1 Tax=Dapis sp. BLCC M126 TaxID=3400189 RepID=UPI003CE75522
RTVLTRGNYQLSIINYQLSINERGAFLSCGMLRIYLAQRFSCRLRAETRVVRNAKRKHVGDSRKQN